MAVTLAPDQRGCNAQTKKGRLHLICELLAGHTSPHRDHDVEWEDSW